MNYVKCLGVIIDESLSWAPHVEYVKKTVSSNMGISPLSEGVSVCVSCPLSFSSYLQ